MAVEKLKERAVPPTAKDIFYQLQKVYGRNGMVLIEEPQESPGRNSRCIDAISFGLFPSRGCYPTGFEIKINRDDWRSELNDPEKADAFFPYCKFFYVVSQRGVVEACEVPSPWGWIEYNGKKLVIKKQAPENSQMKNMPPEMVAALLKRLVEKEKPENIKKNNGRNYMTQEEWNKFLRAAENSDPLVRALCLLLTHTGCRISEAIVLRFKDINPDTSTIRLISRQQYKTDAFRIIPVSAHVINAIQELGNAGKVWPFDRTTAWRRISEVMEAAGIEAGPHATPQAIRRTFGMNISAAHPLTTVQEWMGHSTGNATASYKQIK